MATLTKFEDGHVYPLLKAHFNPDQLKFMAEDYLKVRDQGEPPFLASCFSLQLFFGLTFLSWQYDSPAQPAPELTEMALRAPDDDAGVQSVREDRGRGHGALG